MPEDTIPPPAGLDRGLASSLSVLNEACQRLLASVAESQARSQGMETILALLLGTILAGGAKAAVVTDCIAALKRLRRLELNQGRSDQFPDPVLLEQVISVLTQGAPREPWRPQVVLGGKADRQGSDRPA